MLLVVVEGREKGPRLHLIDSQGVPQKSLGLTRMTWLPRGGGPKP